MADEDERPLRAEKVTRERVTLDPEVLFGNRRWVRDKDGRLVERYGPPRDGDEDMVRTIS